MKPAFACVPGLALLLAALSLGASPALGAAPPPPPGPPEELLDADGFKGLVLDGPWEEAKAYAALGQPAWVDEEGGEDSQLPTKRLLWEEAGPEPEDGETSCRSLRVDLAADEGGRWWVRDLEVGSRFSFPPRVLGLPLEAGTAIDGALTGAVREGGLLQDHLRGLQLWRWPEAHRIPGYRTATFLSVGVERWEANTRQVEAWWRQERQRGALGPWLSWWPGARPTLGLNKVLVPARVLAKAPLGSRQRVKLTLPEGLVLWDEEPELAWDGALGLTLQEGPSAEALKPGDELLLSANPLAWTPEGGLKLGRWRVEAIFPPKQLPPRFQRWGALP